MWNEIDKRINRSLAGVRQAFRSVLTQVDSARKVQLVQADALAGEQLQDNEQFQDYGFTSNPPPGTMAVVLPLGGRTSHGIVIATEHGDYRLKALKPGEVALYTDEGDKFHFKRGRVIDLETVTLNVKASDSVNFETPVIRASGRIESAGDQVAGGISQMEHLHDGVEKGDKQSGPPVGGET